MNYIPVNVPVLSGNEKKYLNECIDSGWISSEGPFVQKFEDDFSSVVGRRYGIAVCNGTAAIDIAIEALDIGPGDEVILPTFTIISCIGQIVRNGAIPILVDADPITWCMNVNQVLAKITNKTKAILVTHIYGLPVDLDPILKIAKEKNIFVIEDAAEVHGQKYKSHPCGSFGDISIFSFYPNKHITTGEGGMIVVDNYELAETCRGLRNLCFQPHKRFIHNRLGWNYRMTNIQAALGLAQLEKMENFIKRKRDIGNLYQNLLADISEIQLPLKRTEYAENIYWVFGIVIKEKHSMNAENAMQNLHKLGVGTRPFFYPMHKQPVFNNKGMFINQRFPVAENLAENGFYLPSGLGLSDKQIYRVAEAVKMIFN